MREEKIKKIVQKFGIDCQKIKKADNAALAEVYVLNNRFILRGRVLEPDTLKKFAKEEKLIERIRPLISFKFPDLKSAQDGEKYVLAEEYFWTLYPIIQGKIFCTWFDLEKASDNDTNRLMMCLRELHDKTKGKFTGDKNSTFLKDIKNKFQQVKILLSNQVIKCVRSAILQASKIYQELKPEDRCFVHGDFHFGNILFNEKGKVAGALDTDWCRVGNYLEDLAFTIMMLLRYYDLDKFQFRENRYSNLIKWYGLRPQEEIKLYQYLILYGLFDVYVFHQVQLLERKKYYLNYQISLLEDFCKRFGS